MDADDPLLSHSLLAEVLEAGIVPPLKERGKEKATDVVRSLTHISEGLILSLVKDRDVHSAVLVDTLLSRVVPDAFALPSDCLTIRLTAMRSAQFVII